jgi:hypothetical protein
MKQNFHHQHTDAIHKQEALANQSVPQLPTRETDTKEPDMMSV